jgi:Uma2 family endonuclease
MTLLQVQPLLNTWQDAAWDEFLQIADDSKSAKLKCYYYDGRMRFEPMSTGADHSKDHASATGHDGCSFRKAGLDEFQPDISYYVGETANAIPWGTRVVDLKHYPVPNLVIEISDTSFADDLGAKRLQYEELGISEYWIVNVQKPQILAFAMDTDANIRRVKESRVLPGLKLEILEQALQRSRQENQSATTVWLMEQFRT